jgi:DNA-binding transcriptional regulator YiaG
MKHDMEWKGKYKSELLMICHMDAKAMHEVGAITDKEMLEYDLDCLISDHPKSSIQDKSFSKSNPSPVYASSISQ